MGFNLINKLKESAAMVFSIDEDRIIVCSGQVKIISLNDFTVIKTYKVKNIIFAKYFDDNDVYFIDTSFSVFHYNGSKTSKKGSITIDGLVNGYITASDDSCVYLSSGGRIYRYNFINNECTVIYSSENIIKICNIDNEKLYFTEFVTNDINSKINTIMFGKLSLKDDNLLLLIKSEEIPAVKVSNLLDYPLWNIESESILVKLTGENGNDVLCLFDGNGNIIQKKDSSENHYSNLSGTLFSSYNGCYMVSDFVNGIIDILDSNLSLISFYSLENNGMNMIYSIRQIREYVFVGTLNGLFVFKPDF